MSENQILTKLQGAMLLAEFVMSLGTTRTEQAEAMSKLARRQINKNQLSGMCTGSRVIQPEFCKVLGLSPVYELRTRKYPSPSPTPFKVLTGYKRVRP